MTVRRYSESDMRRELAAMRARKRARSGGFLFPIWSGAPPDPPVVSAISPAKGNDRGGTSVEITVDDSSVCTGATVGGVALTSFTIVDPTTISGDTGVHARGTVDVVVSGPGGSDTLTSGYEYLDALSFSTCRTWHRADLGLTLTGSSVDAWADQSGAGDSNRNLQAGLSKRPTRTASHANFNGRPTLTFDGSDDQMGVAAAFTGGTYAQPITCYSVIRIGSNDGDYLFDDIDGTSRLALVTGTGGNGFCFAGNVVNFDTSTGTTYVVCTVFNGASSAVYRNQYNTAAATGDFGSNALKSLTVGARYTTANFLTGDLAELIFFSGAHDSTTRQNVMQRYLGDAYGVSVSA